MLTGHNSRSSRLRNIKLEVIMTDWLFVLPSLIIIIGVIVDTVSTYYFINNTKLVEENKYMRYLMEKRLFYPYQIASIVICVILLYIRRDWKLSIIIIIIGLYRLIWGGIRNIYLIYIEKQTRALKSCMARKK